MSEPAGTTEQHDIEETPAQPVYYRLSGCALVFGFAAIFTAIFVSIVAGVLNFYERPGWVLEDYSKWIELAAMVGSFVAALYLSSWLIKYRLRATLWASGIVVGLLIVTYAIWVLAGHRAHADELRAWQAIVQRHSSTTEHSAPPQPNAAVLYRRARDTYIDNPEVVIIDDEFVLATYGDFGVPPVTTSFDTIDELDAALDRNAGVRSLLHNAAAIPDCDWRVVDDSSYYATRLVAQQGHYLSVSADRFILKKQFAEVGADVLALLRLARHARTGTLISLEVSSRADFWALEILRAAGFSPDLPIDALIVELDKRHIWESVRAKLIRNTEDWYGGYIEPAGEHSSVREWEPARAVGLLEFGPAWFLQQSRLAIESTYASPHTWYRTFPEEVPWYAPRARILGSAVSGDFDIDGAAYLTRRIQLAIAALRLTKYREDDSEWPAVWPDAITMPIDPLTGKPFAYTQTEDGFTIAPPGPIVDPDAVWRW